MWHFIALLMPSLLDHILSLFIDNLDGNPVGFLVDAEHNLCVHCFLVDLVNSLFNLLICRFDGIIF